MEYIGVEDIARECFERQYSVERLIQRMQAVYMNGYAECLREIHKDFFLTPKPNVVD
jgi:hypothetical protein